MPTTTAPTARRSAPAEFTDLRHGIESALEDLQELLNLPVAEGGGRNLPGSDEDADWGHVGTAVHVLGLLEQAADALR